MIIGISGRKQAGKNTVANILHGIVLKEQGLVKDWNLGGDGQLVILTEDAEGEMGWGEFDISRRDEAFTEYADLNMWPHVKLYSFADDLKRICSSLFNIPKECVWGTDDQKNQIQEHLIWENLPTWENVSLNKDISHGLSKRAMTAREFMQYFGTDIMRKIYEPIWINSCIRTIKKEQSQLAVIADVRFPNEAKVIEECGGAVVRLTRQLFDDKHTSEVSLDDYPFTHYIDNKDESVDSLIMKVKELYHHLKEK